MSLYLSLLIFASCTSVLTRFNPDDVRSENSDDCDDTGDCDFAQDSGVATGEPSSEQNAPFNGFSGNISQSFVFGQEYQDQGYNDCSIDMSLEPAGIYDGSGCNECDLLGESSANLVTSCSFAENASGTFRMGVDTNNERIYSYREEDGWQPLYDSSACNGGLDVSSNASSISVDCIVDAGGYTQETSIRILW